MEALANAAESCGGSGTSPPSTEWPVVNHRNMPRSATPRSRQRQIARKSAATYGSQRVGCFLRSSAILMQSSRITDSYYYPFCSRGVSESHQERIVGNGDLNKKILSKQWLPVTRELSPGRA